MCSAVSVPAQAKTHIAQFHVYTACIKELSERLARGAITSREIVNTYLQHIKRHNGRLRALIHLVPEKQVFQLAAELDEERAAGKHRGPLHGIPIVLKDNIAANVELGMPTTAGSFALIGMPVKEDAFIVKKLREAGAIIIGKANLSELASYKTLSAQGWSAVGGQTVNVYAAHASPGSSSAGNSVAVAAGFCPASVGTDTAALYALKSTAGHISQAGIVPFAPFFDSAGPIAKDVYDLAILLDVMSGQDEIEEKEYGAGSNSAAPKYVDNIVRPSFEGYKIGVPREQWHDAHPWLRAGKAAVDEELTEAFEAAILTMRSCGAVVKDPADIASAVDGTLWRCAEGARSKVVCADFKEHMARYLRGLEGEGGCRSVEDIIA